MNIGEITHKNLNVRWLGNRVVPVSAPQVSSYIRDPTSSIHLWSSFRWSHPSQKSDLWVQNPNSIEKSRPKVVTKIGKGMRKMNKLYPLPQSVIVFRYKLDSRDHHQKGTPWPSISKISQKWNRNSKLTAAGWMLCQCKFTWHPSGPSSSDGEWLQYATGIRDSPTDSSYNY